MTNSSNDQVNENNHTPSSEPKAEPKSFAEYNLHPLLLKGINACGFTHCTPIQQEVLSWTLRGADAIGKAQTGTGKTAAFLITVINDILNTPKEENYAAEPRALVLAPTRELAMQIGKDAKELARFTKLNIVTTVGGMDYDKQRNQLENNVVDIVVATPGRLIDFCNKRAVFLDQVDLLVIDEADRMLDMGFIPDVKRIIRNTPRNESRQTLLFSATFTQAVLTLASQWTHQPITVEIAPDSVANETVDQKIYLASVDDKYTLLHNMIKQESLHKVIVFANRRDEVRRLHEMLCKQGINAALLSGEVDQKRRIKTLERFRNGEIDILVATDVAGRGIHIDGIGHVVNFTLPDDPEDYVHRIGRTGRAGQTGTSISFACEDDAFKIPAIEELLGKKLTFDHPPKAWTESIKN